MLTGTVPPEGSDGATSTPAPARSRIRRVASWIAKATLGFVVTIMILVGALGLLLDTDLGHRLILDRVAAIAPDSGLRIRIGRIGGSIWVRTQLRDVRLYDPDGLFAEAPQMELDWQPLSWLWNRLVIHEAASELIIVHRAPQLRDDGESTLPRQDLHIVRLAIGSSASRNGDRHARAARVEGEVEYRRGRFLLDLDATMRGGGDRLALLVDARPIATSSTSILPSRHRRTASCEFARDGPSVAHRGERRGRVAAMGRERARPDRRTQRRRAPAFRRFRPLPGDRLARAGAAPRRVAGRAGRAAPYGERRRPPGRGRAGRAHRCPIGSDAGRGRRAADLSRGRYRDVSIAFELLERGRFATCRAGHDGHGAAERSFRRRHFRLSRGDPAAAARFRRARGVTASGSGRWSEAGLHCR